jgi:hypothetical protein
MFIGACFWGTSRRDCTLTSSAGRCCGCGRNVGDGRPVVGIRRRDPLARPICSPGVRCRRWRHGRTAAISSHGAVARALGLWPVHAKCNWKTTKKGRPGLVQVRLRSLRRRRPTAVRQMTVGRFIRCRVWRSQVIISPVTDTGHHLRLANGCHRTKRDRDSSARTAGWA